MTENGNTFNAWLWPDKTIGKRESRELREEHNRLLNSHAELLEALKSYVSEDGGSFDAPSWMGEKAIAAINKAEGK